MNTVTSGTINVQEPIIVRASEFNGRDCLDIRHYYFSDDGVLAHTARGVNLLLEDAEALVVAVKEVVESYPKKVEKAIDIRGADCPVVVSIHEYKGADRLDIRHFWTPKGGKKPVATRKGVNVPVEFAGDLLKELTSVYLQSKVVEIADSQPQVEYIVEQGAGDEEVAVPVPVCERRFSHVEI